MTKVITVGESRSILDKNTFAFEERKKQLEKIQSEEEKKALERKRNKNFVQIYREHMSEMRWLTTNHSFAASVFLYILEKMDGKNALACSFKVLEEYFDKSNSTIQRAIKVLKDNGFLTVAKLGTSNVYLVNPSIAWTSYENQKSNADKCYAELEGKILISRKENIDYENKKTITIKTIDQLK